MFVLLGWSSKFLSLTALYLNRLFLFFFSAKSKKAAERGDMDEARKMGKRSLALSITGIVVGTLIVTAFIIVALWRAGVIKF